MEHWFSQFRGGSPDDRTFQKRLIDTFVNAVYVYDDKLVLTYNYQHGTQTVTRKEVEGQSQILCKLQMRHEQSRIIHCARQRIYPTAACVQYNAGGGGCQGRRQGRRSSERRAQRRADP